jgi:hypothetical protein
VLDQEQPLGLRVVAWARLLKIFAVLRWDDLQRLRPRDVALRSSGLQGRLTQTKTSGAGKKVRDLPLYVPLEAFVIRASWLTVGYELWEKVGEDSRDFFLPRLSEDLRGFLAEPATSRDLSTLGTLVLAELGMPVYKEPLDFKKDVDEGWRSGQDKLIPLVLVSGWTGHSERATLPSLYAAMNVPKSERDPLGRWCPSGSDDYVRTYKALMRTLACRLRGMLLKGDTFEVADEGEAMEDVLVFIEAKGRDVGPEVRMAAESVVEKSKNFYGMVAKVPGLKAPPVTEPSPCDALVVEKDEEASLYVIASSKRGTALCLHRREGCWRAQSLVFHSYELYNTSPVPECLYKTFCRDCWPKEGPQLPEGEGSAESSSSDSSS